MEVPKGTITQAQQLLNDIELQIAAVESRLDEAQKQMADLEALSNCLFETRASLQGLIGLSLPAEEE